MTECGRVTGVNAVVAGRLLAWDLSSSELELLFMNLCSAGRNATSPLSSVILAFTGFFLSFKSKYLALATVSCALRNSDSLQRFSARGNWSCFDWVLGSVRLDVFAVGSTEGTFENFFEVRIGAVMIVRSGTERRSLTLLSRQELRFPVCCHRSFPPSSGLLLMLLALLLWQ